MNAHMRWSGAATLAGDWRLLAAGFLLMFWSSPGQTYLIALYGGELRAAFALGHGELGGLYSLATLASAALLLWSGRWVDRAGLLPLTLALSVALLLACGFMSFSAGAVTLLLAFFLLRHIGQGLMSHVATTSMARYFAARGRATAVAAVGFSVAEAFLPALTLALIALFGWRDAWRITGLVALLTLLPALPYLLRGHRRRHRRYLRALATVRRAAPAAATVAGAARPRKQWTRAEVLRDRRFYLTAPAYLSPSVFFTGFFFHQAYWVPAKGWPLAWWGALFGVYAGAALATTLLSGYWVDRVGATRLLALFPLPLATGLMLLTTGDGRALAVVFLLLTGVTAGWGVTVMGPFWAELYGVRHLGSIKALGSALTVFGSALSPVILGALFDAGFAVEPLALGSAAAIALACAVAALALRPPPRGRDDAPV